MGLCDKEAAVADATLTLVVYLTWFDTGTKVRYVWYPLRGGGRGGNFLSWFNDLIGTLP